MKALRSAGVSMRSREAANRCSPAAQPSVRFCSLVMSSAGTGNVSNTSLINTPTKRRASVAGLVRPVRRVCAVVPQFGFNRYKVAMRATRKRTGSLSSSSSESQARGKSGKARDTMASRVVLP